MSIKTEGAGNCSTTRSTTRSSLGEDKGAHGENGFSDFEKCVISFGLSSKLNIWHNFHKDNGARTQFPKKWDTFMMFLYYLHKKILNLSWVFVLAFFFKVKMINTMANALLPYFCATAFDVVI